MYVYGAFLFYICCSDRVGYVGMFVVEYSVLFSLGVLKYVCVRVVMDVVFSVCIVTCGAVGDRVLEI